MGCTASAPAAPAFEKIVAQPATAKKAAEADEALVQAAPAGGGAAAEAEKEEEKPEKPFGALFGLSLAELGVEPGAGRAGPRWPPAAKNRPQAAGLDAGDVRITLGAGGGKGYEGRPMAAPFKQPQDAPCPEPSKIMPVPQEDDLIQI